MAIPDFLAYATRQAPSPFQSAISSGLGEFQTMQKQRLLEEEAQRQAALAPLQKQALQEKVREAPIAFRSTQQEAGQVRQQRAQQIAAAQVTAAQNKHLYIQNRLAEIPHLPGPQQQQGYLNVLGENKSLPGPQLLLPETYNQRAQGYIKQAMNQSPSTKAAIKFQQQVHLQELKNKGALETAKGAKVIQAPYATQLQKTEAKKDSGYFDKVAADSAAAIPIWNDLGELEGVGRGSPSKFGYMRQGLAYFNSQGQKIIANSNKLVLDLFAQLPHIGRGGRLLINMLKTSKPGIGRSFEAFQNLINAYKMASQLKFQKNNFISFARNNGITNRNRLESIWNKFIQTYPPVNNDGMADPESPKKWMDFLTHNPQLLKGGHHAGRTLLPQGFVMPNSSTVGGAQ